MWVYVVWVEGSPILSLCLFVVLQGKVTSRIKNCPNIFSFSLWSLKRVLFDQILPDNFQNFALLQHLTGNVQREILEQQNYKPAQACCKAAGKVPWSKFYEWKCSAQVTFCFKKL